MRYFIEFAYNGKNYFGFQVQPNAISVQEVLQNALSTILKKTIAIVGAGRTDSGVHAKQMFAHFNFDGDFDKDNLVHKLNSFLPKDLAVCQIHSVSEEAHARFDATSRTYEYKMHTFKDAFLHDGSWMYSKPLNLDIMNEACKILLNYNDFECFSKVHTDVNTFNCSIKEAHWQQNKNEIIFTITADRFLRNMVRAIVGTMINLGSGKISLADFENIIKSKNRNEAGFSVPAQGLYLIKVRYPYL